MKEQPSTFPTVDEGEFIGGEGLIHIRTTTVDCHGFTFVSHSKNIRRLLKLMQCQERMKRKNPVKLFEIIQLILLT